MSADEAVEAAGAGRLTELHDLLVAETASYDDPPYDLLSAVADAMTDSDEKLTPRVAVAIRLLDAGALDAAWAVIRDNAIGVVTRTVRTSTSSGARPTEARLPLATFVEPPRVYAWLPGFRDPRFAAPDAAYDMTDAVGASVRLDEAWWEAAVLHLCGRATLRHLASSADDAVTLLLRRDGGAAVDVAAARLRRPDHVRGTGVELTRAAWAGWSVRVDAAAIPRGMWSLRLRLAQHGIEREVPLGRSRAAVVPDVARPDAGRRAELRQTSAGASLVVGPRLLARPPRQVLQHIAVRARRR
jgi:hypothetical protein